MGVVLAEIGHTPHKNGNKKVRVILLMIGITQ